MCWRRRTMQLCRPHGERVPPLLLAKSVGRVPVMTTVCPVNGPFDGAVTFVIFRCFAIVREAHDSLCCAYQVCTELPMTGPMPSMFERDSSRAARSAASVLKCVASRDAVSPPTCGIPRPISSRSSGTFFAAIIALIRLSAFFSSNPRARAARLSSTQRCRQNLK